jgi:hypothetical protein
MTSTDKNMTNIAVKRGPGRPAGSKNKVKTTKPTTNVVKRGRGRPKGSKNKSSSSISLEPNLGEVLDIPFPNPIHETQRIENIRHMVSFYQHSDGRKKTVISAPKKRGRKSALENFDPEKLLKEDLDSDKLVYKQSDVEDELNRMDGYRDATINKARY